MLTLKLEKQYGVQITNLTADQLVMRMIAESELPRNMYDIHEWEVSTFANGCKVTATLMKKITL